MPSVIHETPIDAHRRLGELGIAVEAIWTALKAGQLARLSCTDNDAPFIPRTEAWRFVVRTLREELLPTGVWRKADPANFSLIISDKREINVVVASGDDLTRVASGPPKTKHLKGLFTEAVTIRNRHHGGLFPEIIPEEVRTAVSVLQYPTWILLIFITDDEIRAELSFPDHIENGQIVSWRERIFIPDSDDRFGALADSGDSPEPDVDVPVRRKKAS